MDASGPAETAAKVSEAIDQYAENVRKFRAGELAPDQFRPLRLGMGVYAQLAHVKHMQRIKIPGGRLTSAQLEALADVTDRWGLGLAHVTTRQDIQIHHLEIEESIEVQRFLAAAGVTTVGACADAVRNVTASHFAGVLEDEVFDVTPYAQALSSYFMFHAHNRRLPRKFKIGLSGSERDFAQAMINDIGLFARITDAGLGFRVYVAGGLGSTPEIAHLWREFIPEREVLLACEAVMGVFFTDGERKNRKKARLKFLLRKLGEEAFMRRLDEELDRLKQSQGQASEEALRRAVVTGGRGRVRRPGDSVWLVLAVEGPAEVRGDTAVLHVDRGTRRCSAAGGLAAFGLTYRYVFQRAGTQWTYVRAMPYIAYDPPPPLVPGQARPRCDA